MFGAKVHKFITVLLNNCFSNRLTVKRTHLKTAGQLLFLSLSHCTF
jgi:hypothetical protein